MIPKFRAFDKKIKEMVNVDAIVFDEQVVKVTYKNRNSSKDSLDNFILMQSTGLFDKNGVEIFEGDVVYDEKVDEIGQIELKDGCFRTITSHYDTLLYKLNNDLKIIGNIYENPGLVEHA